VVDVLNRSLSREKESLERLILRLQLDFWFAAAAAAVAPAVGVFRNGVHVTAPTPVDDLIASSSFQISREETKTMNWER
jgi:hypothetical protein